LPAIYLDIETYRRGGKAFIREEIIAIGVLEEGSSAEDLQGLGWG